MIRRKHINDRTGRETELDMIDVTGESENGLVIEGISAYTRLTADWDYKGFDGGDNDQLRLVLKTCDGPEVEIDIRGSLEIAEFLESMRLVARVCDGDRLEAKI